MQDPAFRVHLVQLQAARFGNTEAVPEQEQQQAAVARLVAAALGGRDQPAHLAAGQVPRAAGEVRGGAGFRSFAGRSHFVESLRSPKALNPRQTGAGFENILQMGPFVEHASFAANRAGAPGNSFEIFAKTLLFIKQRALITAADNPKIF